MSKDKIKIGFVHFDGIYLIHHFISSFAELYKDKDCEVDILTPETNQDYLYSLLDLYDIQQTVVKKLSTYLYKKIAYRIQGRNRISNVYIFKKNKKLFSKYDILVFTVFNHIHIKKKTNQKFVYLMHGVGDGVARSKLLDKEVSDISYFDLITVPGTKSAEYFQNTRFSSNLIIEVCGYQKLDVVKLETKEKRLFKNNNLTIIYNPHFNKDFTSFFKFGESILEFFYNNTNYNLIFAPHMNLFSKQKSSGLSESIINKKYRTSKNIIIDLGSVNSVNMTYSANSDIYLGDVSSQVDEFLLKKPKPCIFINAHNVNWETNKYYQNWKLGKVISNLNNFEEILDTRELWQKEFESVQKKAISYTFDISKEQSSSQRVARAIKNLIIK